MNLGELTNHELLTNSVSKRVTGIGKGGSQERTTNHDLRFPRGMTSKRIMTVPRRVMIIEIFDRSGS